MKGVEGRSCRCERRLSYLTSPLPLSSSFSSLSFPHWGKLCPGPTRHFQQGEDSAPWMYTGCAWIQAGFGGAHGSVSGLLPQRCHGAFVLHRTPSEDPGLQGEEGGTISSVSSKVTFHRTQMLE